jgi:hypothetical protein
MANTDIVYALPDNDNRATVTSINTGGAAWVYGGWYKLHSNTKASMNVYGLSFRLTAIPNAGTVEEYIIEIGIGSSNNVTLKIQMPYSMKANTNVGIYLTDRQIFLPEPVVINASSTIFVRAACGNIAAIRTINGIKLMYTATTNIFTPQAYSNNYQRFTGGGTPSGVS